MAECRQCQALCNLKFACRVHIERVAQVGTYCHVGVGQGFGHAALAVAEVWPRGACADGRELHEVEGEVGAAEKFAPALF